MEYIIATLLAVLLVRSYNLETQIDQLSNRLSEPTEDFE
jgi:hypothetical protein